MLMHGEGDRCCRVAVSHGEVARSVTQLCKTGLAVNRHRIMDFAVDPILDAVAQERVTRRRKNLIGDKSMPHAPVAQRHGDPAKIAQPFVVNPCVLVTPLDNPIRGFENVRCNDCLQGVEPAVAAEHGDGVAIEQSVIAQQAQFRRKRVVVGDDDTAIAPDINELQGVQRKAAESAECSRTFSIPRAVDRLTGVLDHGQPAASRDRHEAWHIDHIPGQMHRDDGLGRRRDRRFELVEIHTKAVVTIDEHGAGANLVDRADRGDEGVCGRNDLVARPDAACPERQFQCIGSRIDADGVPRAELCRKARLEFLQCLAERKIAALDQFLERIKEHGRVCKLLIQISEGYLGHFDQIPQRFLNLLKRVLPCCAIMRDEIMCVGTPVSVAVVRLTFEAGSAKDRPRRRRHCDRDVPAERGRFDANAEEGRLSDRFVLDSLNAAALIATIVVAFGFFGLGRLVAAPQGREAFAPSGIVFDIAAGWGVATAVMVLSALAGISLSPIGWLLLIGGVVSAFVLRAGDKERIEALRLATVVLLLCLPLLLIAAVTPPILYDEFGHWLPNARFVFDFGILPSEVHPNHWSDIPAYPYGGPFVNDLASLIVGQWVDTPSKLLTVMLYGLFGLALIDEIGKDQGGRLPLGMVAVGVALVTLLNPTFDPRIALTAYMDSPSGVLAGLEGLAVWRALSAWTEGEQKAARLWFFRGGYVALAMLSTRDTNIVLLAGIWLGLIVAALPSLRRQPIAALKGGVPLVALPTAGLALWWIYRAIASLPTPIPILPFDQWHWDAAAKLLTSFFGGRLSNHPVLGGAALLVCLVVACGGYWILRYRSAKERSLVIIAAMTTPVWILFLLWSYVASASVEDAAIAISLWRYLGELGPLALLISIPLLRPVVQALQSGSGNGRNLLRLVGITAAVVMIGVPIAFPAHWRNDCTFPDIAAARGVAQLVGAKLDTASVTLLLHPEEAAWLATAVRYALKLDFGRVVGKIVPPGPEAEAAVTASNPPSAILDLRSFDRDVMRASHVIPAATLYRRVESGDGTAKYDDRTPIGPVPADFSCGFPVPSWR